MQVSKITDPTQRSSACAQILKTIPHWFGQAEANAAYEREIAQRDVFGAFEGDRPVGLIALKYHFKITAEIWWMGIRPEFHRRGIGHRLVNRAKEHAHSLGCNRMVLMTLNPTSNDAGYAATRAVYMAQGFEPLVAFNENDPLNPMMWMLAEL